MNSHQKLPTRPGARWLNLKPVSKSSIISYRNSAVKQKKQTNRKHKVSRAELTNDNAGFEKKKSKERFHKFLNRR